MAMLYLEDFLELIENLPAELRDRFTEIRELDLQVQNGLDQSEAHVRALFRNAFAMASDERQREFEKIKEEYRKILEDSDEKVNLATAVHDLLKRYLAKLDVEIQKFKMDLEADKPGITEVLEQSMKGGQTVSTVGLGLKRERRKRRGGAGGSDILTNGVQPTLTNGAMDSVGIPVNGHGREVMPAPVHHANVMVNEYGASIGRGGLVSIIRKSQSVPSRIIEARPQAAAIVHQDLQQHHHPHHSHQLIQQQQAPQASFYQTQQQLQTQLVQNAHSPAIRERTGTGSGSYGFLPSFTDQAESRHGRPRKLTPRVQEMLKEASHRHERLSHEAGPSTLQQQIHEGTDEDDEGEGSSAETGDLSDQNDQQRWCICNQVSYGEMVACDNKDCPFEWFHYQCVGITAPPKGKWFCPHCTNVMKRRNSKNLIIQ